MNILETPTQAEISEGQASLKKANNSNWRNIGLAILIVMGIVAVELCKPIIQRGDFNLTNQFVDAWWVQACEWMIYGGIALAVVLTIKLRKQQLNFYDLKAHSICAQGMIFKGEGKCVFQKWQTFHGVMETPKTWLVLINRKNGLVIPKRSLTPEELEFYQRAFSAIQWKEAA